MFKNYLLVMTEFSALQNVMLIDDDDISLYLTSRRLEKEGFAQNIIKHESVDAAIADLQNNRNDINKLPDLIFLDINMPILSGWDVLDKLEKIINAGTTAFNIYIVSSSIDPDDKTRAAEHPLVKGYIEKPLTPYLMQEVFAA